jgi:hypothetical protein
MPLPTVNASGCPEAPDTDGGGVPVPMTQRIPAEPNPIERATALAVPTDDCAEQLRHAFAWTDGERREVRILGKGPVWHAVASTPLEAAGAIERVGYGLGVYITMNPLAEGALAAVSPRMTRAVRGCAASDSVIARRTRFVIDLDPVRPADTASTDAQLTDALELAAVVSSELLDGGWPRPTVVCSGNGFHLYWGVDLEAHSALPAAALKALDARFTPHTVRLDPKVGNASRIMRVPGTWTAKGDDRSMHRVASVMSVGDPEVLSAEQLESVLPPRALRLTQDRPRAGRVPVVRPHPSSVPFDVEGWLVKYGVAHGGRQDWVAGGSGAYRWRLALCPFSTAHGRRAATITQRPGGAVGFMCHGRSCAGKTWRECRRAVEHRASPCSSGAPPTPLE